MLWGGMTIAGEDLPHFFKVGRSWASTVKVVGLVARYALERAGGSGHHSAHDGDILSPMPGKIIAVEVSQGQTVTKGQKLLTLEAMKMEHTLVAPFDGVVAELSAVAGAQVQVEALLARIEPQGD
jgi:3-methylcrotonyl-CoA carboxylase alpha subunit